MKNIVFIDSNIYLRFYDSNNAELLKLLDSLLEIKENIFVNLQITSEVSRNKLEVAHCSLSKYFKDANITKVILPKHFDTETLQIRNWNQKSKDLYDEQDRIRKELKNLINETLDNIMLSGDKVSRVLDQLFEKAIAASDSEIQLARNRKELGNPPGKPNDPLGDQVTWEQFLKYSINAENIWIITNDNDYIINFEGNIYLNSFLYREIISINEGNPKVFCFNSLSEGLRHFQEFSKEKIESLPSKEDLEAISREELSSHSALPEADRRFTIGTRVNEAGKIIQEFIIVPPGFNDPNQYFQYLRAFDSLERD
jgi:hypothetical protein